MSIQAFFRRSFAALATASLAAAGAVWLAVPEVRAQESSEQASVEEVVVTGTRIRRSEFSSPIPVQSLTEVDIEVSAIETIDGVLNQLPSVVPGATARESQNGTERSGVATAELRGLGTDRTLTLIDGKRVISSRTGRQQVDLSTVPTDFVERIEVLTGGASAIYGSDAMAGVVNIITKKDYEGARIRLRQESPEAGGEENLSASITLGSNFDDDRGNTMLNISYFDRDRLASADRDFASVPLEISSSGVISPDFSSFTPGGRYDLINSSGSRFGDRAVLNADGTASEYEEDVNGYNFNEESTITTTLERLSLAAKTVYRFEEDIEAFVDAYYARTDTVSNRSTESIQAAEFTASDSNLDQIIPVTHPFFPQALIDFAGPGADLVGVEWRRRLNELGGRTTENERQTLRLVGGLRGTIWDDWDWDVSYTYGRTTQNQIISGNTVTQNVIDALDIELDPDNPGQFRCVNASSRARGCVPLDIFGFDTISPEAQAWIIDSSLLQGRLEQNVVTATITGDVLELPAGFLGLALGAEYRRDTSRTATDSLLRDQGTTFVAIPSNSGEIDVSEAFVETVVPLIAEKTGARYLGVDAAVRVADYSLDGVGTVASYKFGAEWAPVDWLSFRGGFSSATRAPNILEAFSVPRTTVFSRPDDPCDGLTAVDTGLIADNCLLNPAIAAEIADSGVFNQDDDVQLRGFNLGNPDLAEEVADTYTFGFVFQPEFVSGLNLTVDYFDIAIEDAIESTDRRTSVDVCYASVELSSRDCDLLFRNGNGQLNRIDSEPRNEAELRTSGIDTYIQYQADVPSLFGAEAAVDLQLNFTHVIENEIERISDPLTGEIEIDDEVGEIETPENRARLQLSYLTGPWRFSWRTEFRDETNTSNDELQDAMETLQGAIESGDDELAMETRLVIDARQIDAHWVHNLSFSREFGDDGRYRLFGGVSNIFDEDPPIIPDDVDEEAGRSSSCNSNCSVFDPVGRSFYLGFVAEL